MDTINNKLLLTSPVRLTLVINSNSGFPAGGRNSPSRANMYNEAFDCVDLDGKTMSGSNIESFVMHWAERLYNTDKFRIQGRVWMSKSVDIDESTQRGYFTKAKSMFHDDLKSVFSFKSDKFTVVNHKIHVGNVFVHKSYNDFINETKYGIDRMCKFVELTNYSACKRRKRNPVDLLEQSQNSSFKPMPELNDSVGFSMFVINRRKSLMLPNSENVDRTAMEFIDRVIGHNHFSE